MKTASEVSGSGRIGSWTTTTAGRSVTHPRSEKRSTAAGWNGRQDETRDTAKHSREELLGAGAE
jgi:hypothetical protein